MDLTIQMRSIELLGKFIKHDLENVPSYGYELQKKRIKPCERTYSLPRCTPEEAGVKSAAVEAFFDGLEAARDEIAAHTVMLLRHGKVIAEAAFKPYELEMPHMLYSMSKSITSTAVGFAVDEGILSVDERLTDIFPEITIPTLAKQNRTLTVKHLLTMSSGSRFNEVGSMLDGNWVKMFLESTPKFELGTAFDYNSINSYMLAAVLRRKTGLTLTEYLKPRLFEPLHIERWRWETCPQGIEKGGWGLDLCIEDAAKIGQLYLQRGMWEGRRLLSERWIDEATGVRIDTPNGECKFGYGYQIWMNHNPGAYQFNGAFGQYVVVMPQFDAVAVVYSGSEKLFAQSGLTQLIDACFEGASDEPLSEDKASFGRLNERIRGLRVDPHIKGDGWGTEEKLIAKIARKLHGREYRMESNTCSAFPMIIQGVHGNYTMGIDMLRFKKRDDGLTVTFYEHTDRNSLFVRFDGGFDRSKLIMRKEEQEVGVRGMWKTENGKLCLVMLVSFIETPDTRILYIEVDTDGELRLTTDESPAVAGATQMLFELVGLSERAYMRALTPAIASITDGNMKIADVIRKLTAPRAYGHIIAKNS